MSSIGNVSATNPFVDPALLNRKIKPFEPAPVSQSNIAANKAAPAAQHDIVTLSTEAKNIASNNAVGNTAPNAPGNAGATTFSAFG